MKIKNWKEFQHFKDRRPPWIKLHRDILERRDINMISDCSFRVLVCLWLLASEDKNMEGTLPPIADISFRLRISEDKITESFKELTHFIDVGDITTISPRYQSDEPETETEAYKEETETEKKTPYEIVSDELKDKIIKLFPAIEDSYDFEVERWKMFREDRKPVSDLKQNLMHWMSRASGKQGTDSLIGAPIWTEEPSHTQ